MDHFSLLPYELRAQICSYHLSDQPCTLKVTQEETGHSEATKDLALKILQTASRLSDTMPTSTAKIAGLIQQIQNAASALSALNSALEARIAAEPTPHFPPLTRQSLAVAELTPLTHATGSPLSVHATSSCRPLLNLLHLNRRMRADLLSCRSYPFGISGSMGVFKRFSPEMSLECRRSVLFVHIAIGKEGPWSLEVQEQFARLGSLPGLETVYVSGVLDDADDGVDDDEDEGPATDCEYRARMALSYRGRSTMHLLKTLEFRNIRSVLCLDAYSERFARVNVRAGRWRKIARCGDAVKAKEDREMMREFLGTAELGRWLYVFEPEPRSECGCRL